MNESTNERVNESLVNSVTREVKRSAVPCLVEGATKISKPASSGAKPIRRRKRGYILTTDQSDAPSSSYLLSKPFRSTPREGRRARLRFTLRRVTRTDSKNKASLRVKTKPL
eukprot:264334-Pyramimonas_sp.AAC.1